MGTSTDYSQTTKLSEVFIPFEMLTLIQRSYIDWKALDGVITDDDGVRELKLVQLAEMLNCSKDALIKTRKAVPNFWDLVTERRKLFNNTSRLAYVHKQWYVKAAVMKDWRIAEAWLRNHDPNFKESKSAIKADVVDAMAEAMLLARKRSNEQQALEGEVVPDADKDA